MGLYLPGNLSVYFYFWYNCIVCLLDKQILLLLLRVHLHLAFVVYYITIVESCLLFRYGEYLVSQKR